MDQNNNLPDTAALPQADGQSAEETRVTMPDTDAGEIKIPVKFNKEERQLTVSEAATLAQKGMKFDMISADFERVRRLAQKDGRSISEYLTALEDRLTAERKRELKERCGGDEELATHIIDLENGAEGRGIRGFDELCEQFPQISDPSELPDEVLNAAEMKGTNLLDEFLRYRHREARQALAAKQSAAAAEKSGVGSQRQVANPTADPQRNEFIKALWGN